MWDINEAKNLMGKARKTDSVLAHKLADYLGYAIASLEYYKNCLEEAEKGDK